MQLIPVHKVRTKGTGLLILCFTIFTVLSSLLFALFLLTFRILPQRVKTHTTESDTNAFQFFTPFSTYTTTTESSSTAAHLFGAGACDKSSYLKRTITYIDGLYSTSDTCSLKICICQGGTAAVGVECPFNGHSLCTTCDSGYRVVNVRFT